MPEWPFGNIVMIKITDQISIGDDELVFKFSRSSGPGGQNVNKINSRVTIFFDLANSDNFSGYQKRRILKRLASRADKNGIIRVASQRYRTQKANRRVAAERLGELLADALKTRPARKKTAVPYRAKQKRLEQKRRRSLLKQQRASIELTD